MIQGSKPEPRIMRHEPADFEWAAIRPFPPNAGCERQARPQWHFLGLVRPACVNTAVVRVNESTT
jgi:hypothetical protein